MERPALQNLINDIHAGRIDCVVVYKVDRLSRSLLDFAKLISMFDEYKVSFVSVTQQFNTTTSMGRLTLNILLSFAQFEREIIGERIRDKKLATARQGKYVGGAPILGYDIINRKYVVNEPEAKIVRRIFKLHQELETSRKVAVILNTDGIKTKQYATKAGKLRGGKTWTQNAIGELLRNRTYTGHIVHKGTAYPGEHQAIISPEMWERSRKIMAANKTYAHKHQGQRFSLLRRMMHCGHCGSLIMPAWTRNHGREYRYYTCAKRIKTGYGNCPMPSIPADQIETAVVDQLRALLRHPDVIARTYQSICDQSDTAPDPSLLNRLDELRRRYDQTQKSIRAVLKVGDHDEGFMTGELKRLNEELKVCARDIRELEVKAAKSAPIELNRVADALRAIYPVWDVLFPEEQRRIVQLLIEDIIVSTNGIEVRFRTNGIEQIVEELDPTQVKERAHG